MDAHLVGYGSSSDEEGSSKKHRMESQKMRHFPKDRNFRKRSSSPEDKDELYEPEIALMNNGPQTLQDIGDEQHMDSEQTSPGNVQNCSRSTSPSPVKHFPGSDEPNQTHRKSNSRSPTSEKETRSNIDEFGCQIRHPSKPEDEDRVGGRDIKRSSSRDRRRSRSRSKSHDRKERRGSLRDDKDGKRRESRDRSPRSKKDRSPRKGRDGSPGKDASPRKDRGPRKDRSPRRERSPKRDRNRRRERSPGNDRSSRKDRSPRKDKSPRRGNRSPRRDRSPRRGDRSPRRGGDRSPKRGGDRSPRRGGDRGRGSTRSWSPDRPQNRRERKAIYLGGPAKPIPQPKEKETMSSEEVMKKLAQRQESLKHEAQANAATHNLPSYLNPSVVNPQLYAKQQEKRKLLWSSKKKDETPTNTAVWSGTKFTGDQGGEMGAKFRRLMGIKGEGTAETEDGPTKGDQILTDLEKEFERSRAFQLSRGAGGKSGIGLGYAPAGYNQ